MHIKQVVVEGFKTYREQTAVDFQPHLNCIGASRRRMRARTFPTAFATLSTTPTYPDHGGKVEFDSGGFPSITVTLPGVIDAIDPLTTDNESPTGTVILMHTLT